MVAVELSKTLANVICADPSTFYASLIFNPNCWHNDSRNLILSCGAELSVLHHCIKQIVLLCNNREENCQRQINGLQQQWDRKRFDLEKVNLLCEQPDLYIQIKAFFSVVKSFLDLIVQLLYSENIVNTKIHGFHRDKEIYGGSVLNALNNNVSQNKSPVANNILNLLIKHKGDWIDKAINARHQLIHPRQGMLQLMLRLNCIEKEGKLVCTHIDLPEIDSTPIDQYAQHTLEQLKTFVIEFITILRQQGSSRSRRASCPG
jgi:hypothetical protein